MDNEFVDPGVKPAGTLILQRSAIVALMSFVDYVDACDEAFRAHALGAIVRPALMHLTTRRGEFHIKGGGLRTQADGKTLVAVKVNGGFFENPSLGMPAIQGSIVLCDGDTGYPLAYMDSGEITVNRTGATTAIAAKALARPDSHVVTICGCGRQGRIQLIGVAHALPITKAFVFDANRLAADKFAHSMATELCIDVEVSTELSAATLQSDVIVTCTPSRSPFLMANHVRPGTFIAAVGADSPDKQELDPQLLARSTVVVDILEQCAAVGELHHALRAGLMTIGAVHAQLGEVLIEPALFNRDPQAITVFDTTGTALQDTAAAVAVYQRALSRGIGEMIRLDG